MKIRSLVSVTLSAALLTAASVGAQPIVPTGVFGAQPTMTFGGSGIPNDAVMTNYNGVYGSRTSPFMALTAHQRYSNPALTNNGAGTFQAMTGIDATLPSPATPYAMWNFGFYIGGSNVSAYTYKLFYDFDPAAGTSQTAQGSFSFSPTGGVIQDSWNLGMGFLGSAIPSLIVPPTFASFDPNAAGQYTFALAAYNGQGVEVDRTAIQVNAGTVVPEPSTYALMLAGLASLGIVARRRKNKLSVS